MQSIRRAFNLWIAIVLLSAGQTALAQESAHEKLMKEFATDVPVADAETTWKLGVRVTGNGRATGLTATFPIPIEWAEQVVTEVSKDQTPNVGRMSVKRVNSEASQVVVRINQLGDGEVAEATITFRVQKSVIQPPEDPSKLSIARKTPSKVRKFLTASPYIEIKNAQVKQAARSIEFAEGLNDWEKVERIYTWVRENIEYRFDTEIHSCMDALESGYGDCEELSSLFIAICRLHDIPARAVWVPGHTYPEFFMVDEEGEGHWFPCQAAGTYAFGTMNELRPILQKGDKFNVPAQSDPMRYLQPTLMAKDVQGGAPVLEFIAEQVR